MSTYSKPVIFDMAGKQGFRSVDYGNGRIFVIKPFRGRQGTTLSLKLGKYVSSAFGGVIEGLIGQIDGGNDVEKLDTIGLMISGVLSGALEELDDPKFQDFFFELFSQVHRDNKLIDYDEEFQLEQDLPFDLVRHIVTYNFASVFQRLGIAALLKKKESQE